MLNMYKINDRQMIGGTSDRQILNFNFISKIGPDIPARNSKST